MSLRDIGLALIVVLVWGLNFIAIKWTVTEWPPLFATGLRYTLVALPMVFFVKKPKVGFWVLVTYGATLGIFKFGLLFTAMHIGMPVGLASLILQSQAFFTLGLAFAFLGERLRLHNYLGTAIAIGGIAAIAFARSGDGATAALLPLFMTIGAAFFWGVSNIVVKRIGDVDMLPVIVWSALVPPLPLFALSYFLEGPETFQAAFVDVSLTGIAGILYIVVAATYLGFGLWNHLLKHYPAGLVAPFSLLVPIVGMSSAFVILSEPMSVAEWAGSGLVMLGLSVAVLGGRFRREHTLSRT